MPALLLALLVLEAAAMGGSGFSQQLLLCAESLAGLLASLMLFRHRPLSGLAVCWSLVLLCDGLGAALLAWSFMAPSWPVLDTMRDVCFHVMRIPALIGCLLLPAPRQPSLVTGLYGLMLAGLGTFLVWSAWSIPHFSWAMTLLVVYDGVLLLCVLPWLQGALAGWASPNRLLWILGWHLFWITHGQAALMQVLTESATWHEPPPSTSVFLAATFCLCLGYMAEIRRWDLGLWPFVLALGIVTVAWMQGLIYYRTAAMALFGPIWLGLGGLTFLITSLGLLQAYFAARDRSLALLERRNEALARARGAKSTLLASMSHELRTPLNAIIGFADALGDGLLGALHASQRDWITEIHRGGEQLLQMIERILMLAKLEAGRIEIHAMQVHLPELLQEQTAALQENCTAAGARLLCLTDHAMPVVEADPAQLRAAIDDLLGDALQTLFTQEGKTSSIILHAQWLFPDRITISCTSNDLASSRQPRVATDAGQSSNHTLSMALLHERMARQGGHVRIISHPNALRTVVLELPVAGPFKKAASPTRDDTRQRPGPRLEPTPWWFMPMGLGLFGLASFLILTGGSSTFRMLALLASGVTFMMAWRAGGAMRWLGVGFGCYALGSLWATAASYFPAIPYAWRWPFFHAGYLFFCLGLWRLRPRTRPRWTLAGFGLLCLLAFYPMNLLLQQGHWLGIHIRYPLLELITLGFAMPGLEAALRGHAAPGRLLWIFAFITSFFTELVSSLLYCPSCPDPYGTLDIIFVAFFINALCGIWAETRRWELRYSPMALGVGGFMVVWIIEMLALRTATAQYAAISYYYWICSGGLVLFLGVTFILGAYHAMTRLAQAALQLVSRKLAAANAAQGKFLATASHQLRTPLHTVQGFAELLDSGAGGALPIQATDAVTHIRQAGDHLLSLVSDIIDLSVVETGGDGLDGRPHKPAAIAIPKLIDNCLAMLQERARKRHITLQANVDADHVDLWHTDERALKQIIFNYLSNAVKFTPEHGLVTISAMHARDLSSFRSLAGFEMPSSAAPQGYLQLSVTDTGMGITPEDQARLFQPFSQTQAGKAQAEGTGLGLALVRRLARDLGGAVAVQSQPAQGSTFHLWLPWQV